MNINEWQKKFGLDNWVITIEVDSTLKQNAKTIADPRYQRAKIFMQKTTLPSDEWRRVIVHELIHIVMSMYDFYVDNHIESDDIISVARENVTSQLGEIFLRNIK